MAIQPVQLFQDPSNNILNILKGGSDVLGGILTQAIQQGRDRNDRRMRQEQDMSAMRVAERGLAERQANQLNQDIFSAQQFAARRSDADRNFLEGQYRFDTAQDAAQRREAEDILQSDRSFDLQEKQFGLNKDKITAQQEATKQLGSQIDAALGTPAPQTGAAQILPAEPAEASGALLPTIDAEATPKPLAAAPLFDVKAAEQRVASLKQLQRQAERDPALRGQAARLASEVAGVEADIEKNAPAKGMTPAQQASAELAKKREVRIAGAQQTAAERASAESLAKEVADEREALNTFVQGNYGATRAFTSSNPALADAYTKFVAGEGAKLDKEDARRAAFVATLAPTDQAAARQFFTDQGRVAQREIEAAQKEPNANAFVFYRGESPVPEAKMTPEQKARLDFWKRARALAANEQRVGELRGYQDTVLEPATAPAAQSLQDRLRGVLNRR